MERSWLDALPRAKRRASWPDLSKLAAKCSTTRACVGAVFVFALLYGLLLPWKSESPSEAINSGEQLTIVLNTFKRLDLLQLSVQHYSQCPVVNRIHVNWAESTSPPDLSEHACCNTPVTFALPLLSHNDSSLNTRFLPIPDLETEAVLNIDDDITVTCNSLLQTFRTWQKHPDQLVGWFPRQVTSTVEPVSSEYHTHLKTLLFDHEYNVILTKGAIMHRKYLEAYSLDTPQELRDLVAERRNCEDILMQFVISSRTESLPVFEWDVSVHDSGAGFNPAMGISQGASHVETRAQCVADFAEAFGGPPASRSVWTHPDALLLMISPPLDTLYQLIQGTPKRHECRCRTQEWHPPEMLDTRPFAPH